MDLKILGAVLSKRDCYTIWQEVILESGKRVRKVEQSQKLDRSEKEMGKNWIQWNGRSPGLFLAINLFSPTVPKNLELRAY